MRITRTSHTGLNSINHLIYTSGIIGLHEFWHCQDEANKAKNVYYHIHVIRYVFFRMVTETN